MMFLTLTKKKQLNVKSDIIRFDVNCQMINNLIDFSFICDAIT